VAADAEALARAAAEEIAARITERVHDAGRAVLVLAGGGTPRLLYRALATAHGDAVPWRGVHVFRGDERWVPCGDARRNARMAHEELLERVPIPPENIHGVGDRQAVSAPEEPRTPPLGPAHGEGAGPVPEEAGRAAEAYARELRAWAGSPPVLDLLLLGMGADGHVASIFPGSSAVRESVREVVAVRAPAEPPIRITLTLPVLNRAREAHLLVHGEAKAEAVARALRPGEAPSRTPAAGLRPRRLVLWLDAAAASRIRSAG
jgi:6-phosphogluconolactonase